MELRQLGGSEIQVPALSLGSWNTYSRLSYEAGVDLVKCALDVGINFFDVAYYRDKPHTEVLWSRLIQGAGARREDYLLSEKLWYFEYPEEPLMAQMDRMLKRIGEDYVDVIIVEHLRDGMDVQDIVAEASELVSSGKARSWGVLNWTPNHIAEGSRFARENGMEGPVVAQLKYSLVRRNVIEQLYAPVLSEAGVSLQASDTLEGGILVGNLNPDRNIGIDVGNIRDKIRSRVPAISAAARDLGMSMAQFALAFCIVNEHTASVLFGATRPETLKENVEAVAIAASRRDEILTAAKDLGIDEHGVDVPYAHDKALIGEFIR